VVPASTVWIANAATDATKSDGFIVYRCQVQLFLMSMQLKEKAK
jgi:hypothetical protein